MNKRVKHIDIAKGISIILVVMYHSKLRIHFPNIIDSMALFRMPLFFLLSGVFFSWRLKPIYFISMKFDSLIKPYFFVLLLVVLVKSLTTEEPVTWDIIGVLYGNGNTIVRGWIPLWFLTHLFSVYIFVYFLFRYVKLESFLYSNWFLIIILICFASYFLDFFWYKELIIGNDKISIPGLPFSVDIILITSSFFIFGCLFKLVLINFKPNYWFFIGSCLVLLIVSQHTYASVNFNQRVYDFPIYSTLGAFCGIYMVLTLSCIISKIFWLSYLLLYIGKSSLYILLFHAFVLLNFDSVTDYFYEDVDESYLVSFVSFLSGVFLPLIIKEIIEKSNWLSLFFLPLKSNVLVKNLMEQKS